MKNKILNIIMIGVVVFCFVGCEREGKEVVVGEVVNDKQEKVDYEKINLKQGIKKDLPENLEIDTDDWQECKKVEFGIKIKYPKYKQKDRWYCSSREGFSFRTEEWRKKVSLNVELRFNNEEDIEKYIENKENCEYERIDDGEVFYNCNDEKDDEIVIGKIMGDDIYVYIWTLESNQDAPADAKEIWYPDVNFTVLDLREIVKSTELLKMERKAEFSENAYLVVEELLRSRKSDVSIYKIFEEIESPFQKNVSAVLFSFDPEKELGDRCCHHPTAIAINNNGKLGSESLVMVGAISKMAVKDLKWLDSETIEYSSALKDELGERIKKVIMTIK